MTERLPPMNRQERRAAAVHAGNREHQRASAARMALVNILADKIVRLWEDRGSIAADPVVVIADPLDAVGRRFVLGPDRVPFEEAEALRRTVPRRIRRGPLRPEGLFVGLVERADVAALVLETNQNGRAMVDYIGRTPAVFICVACGGTLTGGFTIADGRLAVGARTTLAIGPALPAR